MTTTKSQSVDTDLDKSEDAAAYLYWVLDALRPTRPAMRLPLVATDEVLFERAEGKPATPTVERHGRTLVIRLADPWLSSRHAALRRERGGWVIADARSKNGTMLNDAPIVDATVLHDGDVVGLQHSFFLFRVAAASETGPELIDARFGVSPLITAIPHLRRAFDEVALMSQSPLSILLRGETGTGKELIARAVHALSQRPGPFVAVNCGAIPETLVESELFGSKRGAFSGAIDRPGLIRSADGGTLFLDEIGDLPLAAQAALLRMLQEHEVVPVGGTKPIAVDIRVVSASHEDLRRMVEEKRFRADLYQRLAGRRIDVPPLRERREDLGLIIGTIFRHLAGGKREAEIPTLRKSAARAVLLYDWPGNIRELEQALSAAAVLANRQRIELRHLPDEVREQLERRTEDRDALASYSDEDRALRGELERRLAEHRGNITAVARAMGKRRQQVQRWVKRLAIATSEVAPRGETEE